jgi:2-polyprenyl-3-methyl-5-hydroxy-6-metoxy-1,4-benzoquinol methylase
MERIVPDELTDRFGLASLQLHCDRYRFAGQNIEPGRVLDIACGTGYGAYLLASEFGNSLSEIVAVDISGESISYARQRYGLPKIKYMEHDAFSFYDENKFNSIITLETIEHLPNPAAFISRLYDLLLPGGVLIASAPVTPSTDINPYHINDFSEKSFRNLFAPYSFTQKDSLRQTQHIALKDLFGRKKNQRAKSMRKNIVAHYISHPQILFARVRSIFKDGFSNRYTVLALQKKQ